ncbi:hypothetical protein Kpol_1050p27 [Vanderwaltozyma polyspora DSM 70294]|uniref:Pyrimidine 5'-nucleotidase n=1 Tax=Vanderwaltozyma polyspora (strain ATCC 22028 / DSM 70294 / BCRC 21397 / CBS 2163 / NBRC 10782 / NRRL Y-8283 / UCD 57-17) TaxID=436907 RepID=A7TES4_VANPO|nr:uncharacterized protein Kpol_1050p27 [Vanderwaltozyma polyspora DSM 70294]EDO19170.1 hypothetical protein Kpol_1050p27 [Vanderwaltozyma polyspora DSM 70294]
MKYIPRLTFRKFIHTQINSHTHIHPNINYKLNLYNMQGIHKSDYNLNFKHLVHKQLELNEAHLDSLNYKGSQVTFDVDPVKLPKPDPNLKVFFFDIDNTLYAQSTRIQDLMVRAILNYLENYLGLDPDQAQYINKTYYREYGLLIKGLALHNGVNALEYNSMVDDSLPLQRVLKPDLKLRDVLEKLKSSGKFDKLWLFTNAYKNHALRCIRILGIADLFDGITYCDYNQSPDNFICKPDPRAFEKARLQSGLGSYSNGYFIDDSGSNVSVGLELGMRVIQVVEDQEDEILGPTPKGAIVVKKVTELDSSIPDLF